MNPLLLGGLFDVAKSIIDKIWPDPEKKAEALFKLEQMKQTGELAELAAATDLAKLQLQVNIEEAKSPNWWVAGARPFVMWTCGFALAYASLIEPFARFAAQVVYGYTGAFPVIDTTITMQVLFGILGLGAYRTAEKIKGAEGNR